MNIEELYLNALLSQAAYAILDDEKTVKQNETALRKDDGADFNEKQAEEFAKLFPQIVEKGTLPFFNSKRNVIL